jgi:uncharacterized Zn finger protein (UPF0148 family)
MPTAQPAKKVCIVCGADVDGKPRVKDADGRYVCKGACEAKLLKQPKPKGEIPLAEPDDVMAKLVAASPVVNSKPCASCGSPLRAGAVVCTNCGTNIESGKKIKTAIIKEKEQKEPKIKAGKYQNKYAYSDEPNVWKLFLVFSVVLSIVGLLPVLKPELFLVTLIVMIIANILAFAGSAMSAFRNDQTLWGVCHICIFVPFVNGFAGIGVMIYNALFNPDSRSRAMYWATFIGTIAAGIGIAISVMNNVPLTVPGVGAIGGGGTGP